MPAQTVFTPEVLAKLKMAFLIGATDEEACCYADVPTSSFYDYQKRTEGYLEEKNKWKQTPILKARQSLINGLSNPDLALKYLERKRKDEFGLKQFTDNTNTNLNTELKDSDKPAEERLKNALEEIKKLRLLENE